MTLSKCIGKDAFSDTTVEVVCNGTIQHVAPASAPADLYLAPGWIDIQVNGFAGVDYNRPSITPEEIARSLQTQFACGVSRCYPTVITGAPEDMYQSLRNLAHAKDILPEGAAMDGFHVEGPHISPEDGPRGAHPRRWVRRPDLEEYRRWQEAAGGRVRIVTVSPEWPETPRYVEAIVAEGVVAAVGHTQASQGQIDDAVRAGATLSTHLGNGAHAVLRRHPNYIWDQLADDRLMADFIVDGIHLGATFLKVALRAKGIGRSVLVTDAAAPAGCTPGRYELGEQAVDLTPDDRVVLAGTDKLAGSSLRMDRGVENLMKLAGLPLADAVRMATVNAAAAGRVPGRTRGLVAGERADLVQFRFDPGTKRLSVTGTWVDGKQVYAAA
jgi:N-acetylglucosamine-6-phosphate deacetylase